MQYKTGSCLVLSCNGSNHTALDNDAQNDDSLHTATYCTEIQEVHDTKVQRHSTKSVAVCVFVTPELLFKVHGRLRSTDVKCFCLFLFNLIAQCNTGGSNLVDLLKYCTYVHF